MAYRVTNANKTNPILLLIIMLKLLSLELLLNLMAMLIQCYLKILQIINSTFMFNNNIDLTIQPINMKIKITKGVNIN
jgi:hypothetical protein